MIVSPDVLEIAQEITPVFQLVGFTVLSMFTVAIAMAIFSLTWFLADAGIVFSNEYRTERTNKWVELRSIGSRLTDFLRGYASIGAVLSYLQLIMSGFEETGGITNASLLDVLVGGIFCFGIPIFIFITIIPSLIILNEIKPHRKSFISEKAENMGVKKTLEVSIREKLE